MIPKFDRRGNLPPGKPYKVTWEELQDRFGTNEHRRDIMAGLKAALDNLKQADCRRVYINGSFITSKTKPSDWDGCWEPYGVNTARVDPIILDVNFDADRVRRKYKGDLFVQAPKAGWNYLDVFQKDREGNRKGILVIELDTLP